MRTLSKIETMFKMQLELNNRTNGTEWMLIGKTKDGKEINWKRCIYMECAELIDSFNWKHWKDIDGKADMDNAIVEIVDIWHFVMSVLMSENSANAIHIAKKASNDTYTSKKPIDSNFTENDIKKLLSITEKIIAITAFEPSWEEAHAYSMRPCEKGSWGKELATLFFELMNVADMDINTLYAEYITKNTLNIFRQDHGYKENTYKKIWNGKEDNVVARSIVGENPNITPEELMEELEKKYKTA